MKINRLMIITGGTGGHIFPGLVICDYFKKKNCFIKWIGSDRLESILVPKYGFDFDLVFIPSIKKNIKNFFFYIKSIYIIINKIKKWKPDLVLGFGGYISFSGIISAFLCNIPTIIHEQNSVVGFSNKILYYFVNKSLQAFPNSFIDKKVPVVGNPIRKEIIKLSSPNKRFFNRKWPINILVLGGSQGSYFINKIIFNLVKILNKKKYFIWHQIGIDKFFYIKKKKYINYKISKFIYNISEAYNWADLIICRSGALTVSEILYIGICSIFIPFINYDNHQYFNAKILKNIGAAFIINENKLSVKFLFELIISLNREKLLFMANKAYFYKNRINNPTKKFVKEIYKI